MVALKISMCGWNLQRTQGTTNMPNNKKANFCCFVFIIIIIIIIIIYLTANGLSPVDSCYYACI